MTSTRAELVLLDGIVEAHAGEATIGWTSAVRAHVTAGVNKPRTYI